jgi:hypothetical protein
MAVSLESIVAIIKERAVYGRNNIGYVAHEKEILVMNPIQGWPIPHISVLTLEPTCHSLALLNLDPCFYTRENIRDS